MKKNFFSQGIGLLELMLSLAIIAILLIMATRYYQSASNSQKINQGVDMVAALKSAAKNYYHSVSPPVYATSTDELIKAGYLPASYEDSGVGKTSLYVSPWNSALTVSGAGGTITITMETPNSTICGQLNDRVTTTLSAAAGESSSCSTNTLTVIYSVA